jgi:predicted ester cyclase
MTDTERNKQAIRDLLAASDRGDLEALLEFYSPDYVDHDPSESRDHPTSHFEGLRHAFQRFYELFPDTTHQIEDLVAEGDRVVARISAEATHSHEVFGIAPTGRKVQNESIIIYRFDNGKIVERWCRERRSSRAMIEEAAALG